MELAKLVSTVRSLGLAKREVNFLKNYTFHSDTHTIGVDTISDDQRRNNDPRGGKEFKKQTNKQKKTIEICWYCGEKVPHASSCKSRDAICNVCSKKRHFGKFCKSVDLQVKKTNRVSHGNFTKDWNEYLSTMVNIKINGQQHTMKVDSGAEANIISAKTYQELCSTILDKRLEINSQN